MRISSVVLMAKLAASAECSALRSRMVRRAAAFGDIITAEDLRAVQDVLYQPRMPSRDLVIVRQGDTPAEMMLPDALLRLALSP